MKTSTVFFLLTVLRWNLIHRVAVKGDYHTLNLTFGQKKAPKLNVLGFNLAPPAGLEPATSWLTVMRSANWAIEEYLFSFR